jgi:hypothetical protein
VFRPEPFPELELDPERWAANELNHATGIYVRANVAGKWEPVDIAVLAPSRFWLGCEAAVGRTLGRNRPFFFARVR